jgi:hypothetical protein
MSRHVEMSFFKMSRLSRLSRLTSKRSRDRDSGLRPCQKSRLIKSLGHTLFQDLLRRCFSNCQEYLDSQDVIFQTIEIILTVETLFFKYQDRES